MDNISENWIAICAIIGVLGIFMFYLLFKMKNDLNGWVKHIIIMQAEQSKRTDHLYEELSNLVRSRKI